MAPLSPKALPIPAAAAELGISCRQLQRELAAGAPQYRKGRRGNGGQALVDPAAIAAWRSRRTADGRELLRILAAEIPELVAIQLQRQFANISGPHKRATGRELQLIWGLVTNALLERIRRDVPDLSDSPPVPDAIVQIARAMSY